MTNENFHPKYRPDIDGLRAIAVLSVVGYHAFPLWVPGGFVGVDIFFVISGFLISTIIFQGLQRGSFSYVDFYAKRIKRIFPALFVVLSVCLLFGWFVALPDESKLIGKHVLGGATFVSNLLLWSESGYFDTSSELKPLLHLWSLGIEEQYYIFWPLLITFLFDRFHKILPVVLLFLVSAFVLNVSLVFSHPVATFYSPATRFWELLIGSLLAYLCIFSSGPVEIVRRRLPASFGSAMASKDVFAWLGMVLIVAAMVLTSTKRAFPGWWALLPTVGAFLIISAGPTAWFNRQVLANPLLVFFGLISYPLYLWHWPLLTFPRIVEGSASREVRVLAVGASIALAWLTYRFLEKPIRFGPPTAIKPILLSLLIALMGGLGGLMYFANGFPDRYKTDFVGMKGDLVHDISTLTHHLCPTALETTELKLDYCIQTSDAPPVAAVFGDSHADHIFPGIAVVDREHSWLLAGHSSCPPVSGILVEGNTPGCQKRSEEIIRYLVSQDSIKTVVFSFFGNYFKDTDFAADHLVNRFGPSTIKISGGEIRGLGRLETFELGLERAVAEIERSGKVIVIIIDVPELPFFPKDCVSRPFKRNTLTDCFVSHPGVLQRQDQLRAMISRIRDRHPQTRVFDPLDFMCDGKVCRVEVGGTMIYRDSHHLSIRGSELFARSLIPWLYAVRD